MTFIGIEAGGTKIVCGAGTGPDDLTDVVTFPTTSPDETIGRTRAYVLAHTDGLDGVGVASFGPVDLRPSSSSYGFITSTPKPGWNDIDLLGPIRARGEPALLHLAFKWSLDGATQVTTQYLWHPALAAGEIEERLGRHVYRDAGSASLAIAKGFLALAADKVLVF